MSALLPVVPHNQINSPTDRVRCAALDVELSAAECVRRHAHPRYHWSRCPTCTLGAVARVMLHDVPKFDPRDHERITRIALSRDRWMVAIVGHSEARQAAWLALWRCHRLYDPKGVASFETYALASIRFGLLRALRERSRDVSLDEPLGESGVTHGDALVDESAEESVESLADAWLRRRE